MRPVDTQSERRRHSSDLRPPKPGEPEWPKGLDAKVEGEGWPSYRITNGDIKFGLGRKQQKFTFKKNHKKNPTNFKAREAAILWIWRRETPKQDVCGAG